MPYTPTSSGLSGVLFVLARYVARERHPHHNHDWGTLQFLLYELALRYMLVADEHQREATLRIVAANKVIDGWEVHPKHVDPQDSRCIMTAFIHTMSRGTSDLLLTEDPLIMLRLVHLATDAETQDLLPAVIRSTLVYVWAAMNNLENESKPEGFHQWFIACLSSLIRPLHNRPYPLTRITQSLVMDAMHESDFLDLIASIIVRLKPGESRYQAESSIATLGGLGVLFKLIVKAVPEVELGECFKDYVPAWWKAP
ncbi:unnamed protein product [Rhizoctonia solani]|uniref:Uncharacterized protein n=1 Tax=Rhizoctonia solani TaxID=456999 RepID=A0A8H3HF54_9AGAM|nr:unnamed protein product [Rhizoctonia solani]